MCDHLVHMKSQRVLCILRCDKSQELPLHSYLGECLRSGHLNKFKFHCNCISQNIVMGMGINR